MRMRAAVLTAVNAAFQIADVDLAPPQRGEVVVKIAASGAVAEGHVVVPDQPGWGVEIEPEWLSRSAYLSTAEGL
jgi:L-alanine-DL-glutamate epimerase-like enolase superfamily enzyme